VEGKHKIYIQQGNKRVMCGYCKKLMKRAVVWVLLGEKVDLACTVDILVTDNDIIHTYNRDYRGLDKTTDVLSFPMQIFDRPGWNGLCAAECDMDTGYLPLGDIIISAEAVRKQAAEYGNSVLYETTYLIIHSTLHLLGYDHNNEANEKTMHDKSKKIMQEMGFAIDDQ